MFGQQTQHIKGRSVAYKDIAFKVPDGGKSAER